MSKKTPKIKRVEPHTPPAPLMHVKFGRVVRFPDDQTSTSGMPEGEWMLTSYSDDDEMLQVVSLTNGISRFVSRDSFVSETWEITEVTLERVAQ